MNRVAISRHPLVRWLRLLLGWVAAAGAVEAAAPVVRVAAAASLADALKEIGTAFSESTGVKVELNLGASNALVRQIAAGVPADVFISADSAKMDELAAEGLIEPGSREDQLSNTLVVVVPADSALKIREAKDLTGAGVQRLVTGDPQAVPVGVYARQYLEKLGVWDRISPKLVAAPSARAALAAVESGNIDAGIVYQTDARMSKKVRVALEIPADEGPKITYPMAALKAAAAPALARRYLDHLDTAASRLVFEKFGFIVLPEADGDR